MKGLYCLGRDGDDARSRRVDAAVSVLKGRKALSALRTGAFIEAAVDIEDD